MTKPGGLFFYLTNAYELTIEIICRPFFGSSFFCLRQERQRKGYRRPYCRCHPEERKDVGLFEKIRSKAAASRRPALQGFEQKRRTGQIRRLATQLPNKSDGPCLTSFD